MLKRILFRWSTIAQMKMFQAAFYCQIALRILSHFKSAFSCRSKRVQIESLDPFCFKKLISLCVLVAKNGLNFWRNMPANLAKKRLLRYSQTLIK